MRSCLRISRRHLLSAGAAGLGAFALPAVAASRSPNEKLQVAVIGVGGMRGGEHLSAVARENVVALCDVDARILAGAAARFPKARTFADFRKMFDAVHRQIDAVVISTPDHTHAAAGMAAMRLGKHCYCEKPLAHSVYEARQMARIAREKKLATQLGTQIHAEKNYRRAVELVQSGAIGEVAEVHVWLGANFNGPPTPTNMSQADLPTDTPPIPPELDWDLWLGPVAYRPYHPTYVPANWRQWWAFGSGTLGDFFCHFCDLAFWALDLRHPTSVAAIGPLHPESAARWTVAKLEFPARGSAPPVTLTWCNGGGYPALVKQRQVPLWQSGVLFVGTAGMLLADYGRRELLPKAKFAGFKPPVPSIPNSIGHHAEWIAACKTDSPTTCNFTYGGALSEAALLCNVALRTGKKLTWDAEALVATNCPEAERFIRPVFRAGWTL
jgi:predicted dehydrogenase